MHRSISAALAASLLALATGTSPGVLASESKHYDDACVLYYEAGNDPNVSPEYGIPAVVCECMAERFTNDGLPYDALEFFARTYLEDLTTFIHEYPDGNYWMDRQNNAFVMCTTG